MSVNVPEGEDIFKIQKPMNGFGPALIYNQTREFYAQMDMTPEIAMLMGTEYKIYVRGRINEKGILDIQEKLSYHPTP